jgi:hypothetical protein
MKARPVSFAVAAGVAGLIALAPATGARAAEDGWTNLFDGKSLAGWRGYKQDDASKTRWKVEDGMLAVDPAAGPRGRDLVTVGTYDNFELEFEWKVSPGGNSGLKYFVLEDRDSAVGHEYQILDDAKHPDGKIGGHRQTASLYDVLPAANRPLKEAGEFNHSRVVVNGRTVEHYLNGTRVLQYELSSPALQAAIEKSKFKGIERFGKPQKGHILLQDHNDKVWFRSVRIRAANAKTL